MWNAGGKKEMNGAPVIPAPTMYKRPISILCLLFAFYSHSSQRTFRIFDLPMQRCDEILGKRFLFRSLRKGRGVAAISADSALG